MYLFPSGGEFQDLPDPGEASPHNGHMLLTGVFKGVRRGKRHAHWCGLRMLFQRWQLLGPAIRSTAFLLLAFPKLCKSGAHFFFFFFAAHAVTCRGTVFYRMSAEQTNPLEGILETGFIHLGEDWKPTYFQSLRSQSLRDGTLGLGRPPGS